MTQSNSTSRDPNGSNQTTNDDHHLGVPEGLTVSDLVDCYRQMVLVRKTDERVWMMNRQGKVPIAASCQGHEATQLGSLLAAKKDGRCFLFPYYRDLAVKMAAGLSAEQVMLSFMGKEGDPYSGARQFPLQGADLKNKIIQISNVVAAGVTQGVGYAMGCRMSKDDTVVLVYLGDGATSQGETHEAMNFAGVHSLPVVFICENNGYAISVPQRQQMAIEDVASRAEGYGFRGLVIDGMDLLASYQATREGVEHARSQGPVLLEMKLERLMPHTSDDDDTRYRGKDELAEIRLRDPLVTFPDYLKKQGFITDQEIEQVNDEAQTLVNDATDLAESTPPPDASGMLDFVYAP